MKIRYVKVTGNTVRPLPERLKAEATHEVNVINSIYKSCGSSWMWTVDNGDPRVLNTEEIAAWNETNRRRNALAEAKALRDERMEANLVMFGNQTVWASLTALSGLGRVAGRMTAGASRKFYQDLDVFTMSKADLVDVIAAGESQLEIIQDLHIATLEAI